MAKNGEHKQKRVNTKLFMLYSMKGKMMNMNQSILTIGMSILAAINLSANGGYASSVSKETASTVSQENGNQGKPKKSCWLTKLFGCFGRTGQGADHGPHDSSPQEIEEAPSPSTTQKERIPGYTPRTQEVPDAESPLSH
jgi:hypothetical protein